MSRRAKAVLAAVAGPQTAVKSFLAAVNAGVPVEKTAFAINQLGELLLFTRATTEIRLRRSDGTRVHARREITPAAGGVNRLRVVINTDGDETVQEHFRVTTTAPDPPRRRHGRVDVALPITPALRGPGRVFCTFPTETDTALHFSINAAFQPLRWRPLRRLPITFGWMSRRPVPGDVMDSWLRPCQSDRKIRRDVTRLLRAVDRQDLIDASESFGSFGRPVLVVWAGDDRVMPAGHGPRLAELFPDARLEIVEGSRTLVPIDQPAELTRLISEFVVPVAR